jgi:WD40 repeat protein
MNIKRVLGIAALLGLGLVSPLAGQPPAGGTAPRHPLTLPVVGAPPGPAVECVVNFGPAVPLGAVAFSPDGKTLAVGGYQEVLLWDLPQARLAKRIGVGQLGDVVRALVFRKDGRMLAVGDGVPRTSGAVKIFDVGTGQLSATFPEPKDAVYSLALSPDGKLLAAGAADASLCVWNLDEKKLLACTRVHRDRVVGVAFSADGKFLASGSADKSGRIWEVGTWKPLMMMDQVESVQGVAFSPDAQFLALAVGGPTDHMIRLRRRDNADLARATDIGVPMPLGLAWIASTNRIYVPSTDMTTKVFDGGNGGQLATLAGHTDWVYGVAASADGSKIATASADGTVKLWNAADNRLLATLVQLAPRTDEWLIVAPPGYLAASSAGVLQWKTANVKTPPDKLAALLQNPPLVRQSLAGAKPAPPAIQ